MRNNINVNDDVWYFTCTSLGISKLQRAKVISIELLDMYHGPTEYEYVLDNEDTLYSFTDTIYTDENEAIKAYNKKLQDLIQDEMDIIEKQKIIIKELKSKFINTKL